MAYSNFQVTLGVLMRNENTREDMAAIAEHVVDNYVPVAEGRSREADEDKIHSLVISSRWSGCVTCKEQGGQQTVSRIA